MSLAAIAWVAHCTWLHRGRTVGGVGVGGVWPNGAYYEARVRPVRRVRWPAAERPFAEWLLARSPREPLVLTGPQTLAAARWRATGSWSPEHLSAKLGGGRLLSVRTGRTPVFQYVNPELLPSTRRLLSAGSPYGVPAPHSRQNMTMGQFWAAAAAAARSSGKQWVMYSGELGAVPELAALARAELPGLRTWAVPRALPATSIAAAAAAAASTVPSPPPSHRTPPRHDHAAAAAAAAAAGGARGSVQQLWLGWGGATSQPHYDQQHNFFFQLYGTKRFLLSPPAAVAEAGWLFPRLHACTRAPPRGSL
jgi:hypothetical protein